MDNLYYKQIFGKFSGYVYQYTGKIPDNEDSKIFLVNKFVSLVDKVGLEINLTELSNGKFVLHSYENLESELFVKLYDLGYDPLPEPEPILEPEPISEPVKEE